MLILIGGADKEQSHIFLKNIITKSNIREVAILTSATRYLFEVFDQYKKIFEHIGCNVTNISNPETEEAIQSIQKCDMIFMTGGDQRKLVEKLRDSMFLRIMRERYEKRNIVIAGTSAGAMAVSEMMIIGKDDDYEMIPGLDFLKMTVDTHFTERKRLGRLSSFMMESNTGKGIGIDEDTCLVITEHFMERSLLFEKFEARGAGSCYLLDKSKNRMMITILRDEEVKIDK